MRWIADGGMGTVFEAENTWTRRRVALKLLDPEVSRSPDRVQRFVREARSATRIDHPNIVDVLDMGEDKPTKSFFIVQELLRGRDLRRMLRDTPGRKLDPDHALTLLTPIMEALEAAHQLGVIHRDVKPGNIFLAQQGVLTVPKLIDFGLSKLVRRDPADKGATTGGGMPLGTPYYMSPEQARGEAELDGRSDLWSIGVVLYECLTGHLPFEGANVTTVLLKIANERPRPVDEAADVPAEIAAIVHRALEPERERRWDSMTAMLHAIRDYRAPIIGLATHPTSVSGAIRIALPADLETPDTVDEEARRAMRSGTAPIVQRKPAVVERMTWQPKSQPPPPAPISTQPRPLREGPLRLGVVLASAPADVAIRKLSKVLARDFKIAVAHGYANLVDALAEGELDVAWLPPVAYVRAQRSGAARLMLTLEREGRRSYSAAIVTRSSDTAMSIHHLSGKHAAWLDPWSAAGYLVPRCMLRAADIEPDSTFSQQSFHGSYEGILQALLDGTADVGAMFCRIAESGEITGGAWHDDRRIRPLAVGAEPVPGDTICVTSTLSVDDARTAIERFIESGTKPAVAPLFREVFGTDRFVAANASRYEGLEAALAEDMHSRR